MSLLIDPVLLGDTLKENPFVNVDLLRTLPTDMDVNTWQKQLFPGYETRQAFMELIADNSPEALLYRLRVFFDVAVMQESIPFYGISLFGRGLAIGQVLDSLNQPVVNFQGLLDLTITVLYQSFLPPV